MYIDVYTHTPPSRLPSDRQPPTRSVRELAEALHGNTSLTDLRLGDTPRLPPEVTTTLLRILKYIR